jgi:FKBP-type peptidyl-prolyl cis-trans isomerase
MTVRRAASVVFAIALATLAALFAAGCGSDDKKSATTPASSSSSSGDFASKLKVPTDLSKKPTIASVQDLAPMKLVTKDVVTGTGAVAKEGDKITVQYVGVSYSTDKEFDSSWGRQPFSAVLEAPGLISGWVKGIPGMKVGGRRVLVIPSDLGYGSQGSPPDIAPGETLIFVIDLKKIG